MIRLLLAAMLLLVGAAGCDKTIHEVRHNQNNDDAVALSRPAPSVQP